eukprot:TRINITY_DN1506_c0_g1_i2.p1 TRINITY_DN1506_c0_g1~~TRINITY_DN1506_c0_g1_i2.p1  ORF type:complete len:133 (+),score=35.17 TRINITY_DN1506_c0_g1_i2:2-400(+)
MFSFSMFLFAVHVGDVHLLFLILFVFFFFFKQKTAYEMLRSLVGSEMCIRDSGWAVAAKEAMDSSVMLGSQRLGGLPTSNVLYHSYHGSLTDIDINDLYGRPEHNPLPVLAPRAHFEKQFHGEELTIKQVKL